MDQSPGNPLESQGSGPDDATLQPQNPGTPLNAGNPNEGLQQQPGGNVDDIAESVDDSGPIQQEESFNGDRQEEEDEYEYEEGRRGVGFEEDSISDYEDEEYDVDDEDDEGNAQDVTLPDGEESPEVSRSVTTCPQVGPGGVYPPGWEFPNDPGNNSTLGAGGRTTGPRDGSSDQLRSALRNAPSNPGNNRGQPSGFSASSPSASGAATPIGRDSGQFSGNFSNSSSPRVSTPISSSYMSQPRSGYLSNDDPSPSRSAGGRSNAALSESDSRVPLPTIARGPTNPEGTNPGLEGPSTRQMINELQGSVARLEQAIHHQTTTYRADQAVLIPALERFSRATNDQETFTRAILASLEPRAIWQRNIDRSLRRLAFGRERQTATIDRIDYQFHGINTQQRVTDRNIRSLTMDAHYMRVDLQEIVENMSRFISSWEVESQVMLANQILIVSQVSWLEPVAICFQFLGWLLTLVMFWRWGRAEMQPPHVALERGQSDHTSSPPPSPPGPPPPPPPSLGANGGNGQGGGGGDGRGNGGNDGNEGNEGNGGNGGNGENGENGGEEGEGGNRGEGVENAGERRRVWWRAGDILRPEEGVAGPAIGESLQEGAAPAAEHQPAADQQPVPIPFGHVGSPFRADGLPWQTYRRPSIPERDVPIPIPLFSSGRFSPSGIEVVDQTVQAARVRRRASIEMVLVFFFLVALCFSIVYSFMYPGDVDFARVYNRSGATARPVRVLQEHMDTTDTEAYKRGGTPARGAWLDEPVMKALFGARNEAQYVAELAAQSAESVLACAKLAYDRSAEKLQSKQAGYRMTAADLEGSCEKAVRLGAEATARMKRLAVRLEWVFGQKWWATLPISEKCQLKTAIGVMETEFGAQKTMGWTSAEMTTAASTETAEAMEIAAGDWPERKVPAWV